MIALDRGWTAANRLPPIEGGTDKNARGRVFAIGGSRIVPGALLLTGEAALRAGAGKVRLGTLAELAPAIAGAFPEAGVIALAVNAAGELAADAIAAITDQTAQADALVAGIGMGRDADASAILRALLDTDPHVPLLLDAALLRAVGKAAPPAPRRALVLTPHPGEMAAMMDCGRDAIGPELAEAAAVRFSATVVLKSAETWIATAGEPTLHYAGGGPGLATAGSGDVLAGVIGGLLARRMPPHLAAAWGVWAHGEAGRRLAQDVGPTGFLARELPPLIPRLLA